MLLGGKTVFPITLAGGPPLAKDPATALAGWTEVAQAGVKMLRVYPKWNAANAAQLIQDTKDQLDAAEKCGLQLWVGLFDVANDISKQPLLEQIVDGLKDHPGLGAWKGADEPLWGGLDANGLAAAYDFVRARDPGHPLVIIQAPKVKTTTKAPKGQLTATLLKPYAAAGDIHGVDIYPISHPPGTHADRPNRDISVVGDVTEILVRAAPEKEHWTTLQIAWSGVLPPNVPIFPSLRQERFMVYQAIVAGARGLVFFGGDLTKVMSPEDKAQGWNWTFWNNGRKHLVQELNSTAVGPALVAPPAAVTVKASAPDVRLVARQARGFLYLIVVRRSAIAPKAEIILTGAWNFDVEHLAQTDPLFRSVDATIARVAAGKARVAKIYPVFDPAGSPDRKRARLCALTFNCSKGDPHPTDAAYRAMAAAFLAASGYTRHS